jgi:PleD family two-component response regulator
MGIFSCLAGDTRTLDEALCEVDGALYAAKTGGRNRCWPSAASYA